MEKKIELYGTGWCSKSAIIRNFLQSQWIEFDDFNVEENKDAEEKVRNLYDGKLKFPTLIYGDQHLKNPTIPELKAFLNSSDLD